MYGYCGGNTASYRKIDTEEPFYQISSTLSGTCNVILVTTKGKVFQFKKIRLVDMVKGINSLLRLNILCVFILLLMYDRWKDSETLLNFLKMWYHRVIQIRRNLCFTVITQDGQSFSRPEHLATCPLISIVY